MTAAAPKPRKITFEEVNSRALAALPHILARVLPGGKKYGNEYKVRNPTRADNSPGSFSVNTRTGKWADFATGDKGGDPVSLVAYLEGIKQSEALERLAQMLGLS